MLREEPRRKEVIDVDGWNGADEDQLENKVVWILK